MGPDLLLPSPIPRFLKSSQMVWKLPQWALAEPGSQEVFVAFQAIYSPIFTHCFR